MRGIAIRATAPDGTERKLAFQWEPGAKNATVIVGDDPRGGDPGDTISVDDLRKALAMIEQGQP